MLLSLPTELILEIVAHLRGDEVSQFSLALTCRRIYADIIQEVRKEHAEHVKDFLIPVGFLGIYKSDSAIVPRHKGVHGVEIGAIPAEAMVNGEAGEAFQGNTRTVNIWLLPKQAKDVRAVRSFLVSTPALKHIHLQLPASCQLKVLVNTLSMCAARPSTRLTITDSLRIWSRKVTPALGRTTSSTLDKSRSSKLRLPEALRRLRGDIPSLTEFPAITALSIANDILFFFEIYPFLLRIINTAPLEFLHIGRPPVHGLGDTEPLVLQSQWTTILSSITTRASRIAFTLVPLAPEDLIAFLARHPRITHLALEMFTLTGGVSFSSAPLLLPNLTTLEGTASTVLPFLAAQKDGHLPALQHLILKVYPGRNNPSRKRCMKIHPLHAVYDHITRHKLQYTSIQVTSLFSSGLISWIYPPNTNSSPSASSIYHSALQRQLINVKRLIFKHADPHVLPSMRKVALACINAHSPSLMADNDNGEPANYEDIGADDTSTEAQEKQNMLKSQIIWESIRRRACPDLVDIEMMRLPEVSRSAAEIMDISRTPGSS
jgi:hypothetical protein